MQQELEFYQDFKDLMLRMAKLVIYTSEWLERSKRTAGVAEAIHESLAELNIEHRVLKHTNDYWCRDYMPVSISDDGTYCAYEYNPDYLLVSEDKQIYITDQRVPCEEIGLQVTADMEIVFDGGNYVRCGDKVVMTDKIFVENPKWPASKLLSHLEKVLNAEIVLLPWDMADECGHSDGMVAYLGGGRILLNGCWKDKYEEFHLRLMKILEKKFDEVVVLSLDCKADPDSWCYLNFLQVPGGILLPCLSELADCESDVAAIRAFESLFPGQKIKPIYARPLITRGGALHCVTWEWWEDSAS